MSDTPSTEESKKYEQEKLIRDLGETNNKIRKERDFYMDVLNFVIQV